MKLYHSPISWHFFAKLNAHVKTKKAEASTAIGVMALLAMRYDTSQRHRNILIIA
jgi:hypothetical protein